MSAQETEARLREDAGRCLRAALEAADPDALVARALAEGPAREWREEVRGGDVPVTLLAVGKAAGAMARAAGRALGDAVRRGVVLLPEGPPAPELAGVEVHRGGHPLPTAAGVEGARAVREAARSAGAGERVLLLLSGGGSALLTLPPEGVELEDVRETTDLLLRAGAPIGELNAVRKHLDALKGGRLAREAAPAPLLALVLSDVVGDRLDVIASGPVVPDPTSYADALDVLRRRDVLEAVPRRAREHLERGARGGLPESPGEKDPAFDGVRVHVIGNGEGAARAALAAARELGYATELLTATLTGEAREEGRRLGERALAIRRGEAGPEPPAALAAAGETTVTVTGEGKGGRNQEVALGAAVAIDGADGVLVASLGTDGIDGPTDAAGALATGTTVARAGEEGVDPADALAENDAYPFFRALGDLLVTGPTGTNVMDVQLVLVGY